MNVFMFMIGLLAVSGGIVSFVINLIKKEPFKKSGITILVGVAFMVIGLFITMGDESKPQQVAEKKVEEKQEVDREEELEDVYMNASKEIDETISNTYKGEKHSITVEDENDNYRVLIGFDAEDNRFSEAIECGIAGLIFIQDMKEYNLELDKEINTYELSFFANNLETYSTIIDNSENEEIEKINLISKTDKDDDVVVTNNDVEQHFKNKSEEKAEKEAEKYNTGISRNDMARDKDGLKGKYVTFSGTINQVMKGSGYNQYRLAVDDDFDKMILIQIDDDLLDSNILEDDHIKIEGESTGNQSYTTVMGAEQTIPGVIVHNVYLD